VSTVRSGDIDAACRLIVDQTLESTDRVQKQLQRSAEINGGDKQ